MSVASATLPSGIYNMRQLQPKLSPALRSTSNNVTQASSSKAGPRGGQRKKKNIDAAAVKILVQIPGITKDSLHCWLYLARELTLEKDDFCFDILDYVNNSQEHKFGIKVVNIVRIVRNNNVEFEHDRNVRGKWRMMLWHGTTIDAVPKILEEGFQIPDNHGQMLGPGIYFADRVSKSALYCDPNKQQAGSIGYLFLCDVLLGRCKNSARARNDWSSPPRGYDSVRITGRNVPNRAKNTRLQGSFVPKGETIVNMEYQHYAVQYNEYVVYTPEKVKPKYLVKVEFTDSKYIN